jgi:endoglucanase
LNPQPVSIPDLLRDLVTAAGPSGHEEPAATVWREAAAEFAEVTNDTLGTSFARVGTGGRFTFAAIGHIDEIGIVITHVGDDGLLSYRPVGTFDAEVLAGQRVVVDGRNGPVSGVVGPRMRTGPERSDVVGHDDLHIDIGATDGNDAAALVAVGDTGVWQGEPLELQNGRLVSRALDDRLGAYAVLEAARRIGESGGAAVDVVAVASVQEETGHSGARVAAFALEPDVAIAVDVTYTTDVPGGNPRSHGKVELGSGAVILRGPVANRRVTDLLVEIAEAEGIPYALEVWPGLTHTDADHIHTEQGGVPTAVVSIPLRYMHSPTELCSLADVEAVVHLLVAFAGRLTPETSFLR